MSDESKAILKNPLSIDNNFNNCTLDQPIDFDDSEFANYYYEIIMERIKEFEDSLDNEHEVAAKLSAFGTNITMVITEISYSNPKTLVFYGYVSGQYATLIQNVSQLNFLLLAVKKADPEKPPHRIVGFAPPNAD